MSLELNKLFFIIIIALSSCMTATPNLRVINGETQMSLTQSAPISRGADISPDGKYLLTGGLKVFCHWDISKGMLINRYSAELSQILGTLDTTGLIPVAFVTGGNYALSGGEELKLWDLSSGSLVKKIGSNPAASIGVSSDGKKVLTCVESEWSFLEDKMIVHDIATGNKIAEWNASGSGGIIALSPDGKYAISTGGGGRKSTEEERGIINLWNVSSGEILHTFAGTGNNKDIGEAVLSIAFSQDGKYVLSGGTDGSIKLWDVSSGTEIKTIQAHTGTVGTKAVAFSPDGRFILSVGGSDGLARLWNISSGSLIRSFKVSDDRFVEIRRFGGIINGWVAFTPDSKRIIYMGSDASFRIFDVATGNEIATLIVFDDGEWLVVTPEGYYNASEKGAQYLKVKYEGKDYSVDQFYDVFYRPDMVVAKLSGQDISGFISITMKDASKNPPPVIEFTTSPSETHQSKIKICYNVKSAGGGVGEVRVFHNGKLVQSDGYYRDMAKTAADQKQLMAMNSRAIYEDMRGIKLKGRIDHTAVSRSRRDTVDNCVEIDAIPGENEISVAAFNGDNTVQSYMKTVKYTSKIKAEDPHLYILSIGIDEYKDRKVNLKYAAKDAKDIKDKLIKQCASIYMPNNIHHEVLLDNKATKNTIINRISELSRIVKPNDGFILFVAGHGVLIQTQYYMLTSDYNGTLGDESMISSNEIVEMSKKIKSLSQLFIFDTCHAGGLDAIVSGLYDARMSVLAKKMGLHIYASANSIQEAKDGYRGNGLFTYNLLDGISNKKEADKNKDNSVSLVELGEYSKKATVEISKKIGHTQTPLIINFGKDSPVYVLK